MGNSVSAWPTLIYCVVAAKCRRRSILQELGVPTEYEWEGLAQDKIDAYYCARERAQETLEKGARKGKGAADPEWIRTVHEPTKVELQRLLLQRAEALVHVLKPIEEQRRSMFKMHAKGYLPENHMRTFERADCICQEELRQIMEEGQFLAPGSPPNEIIQIAAQRYHEQLFQRSQEAAQTSARFADVKRGFFKNASAKAQSGGGMAHGFEIGAEVEAHSLQTASLNGVRGRVLAAKGERVAVAFPDPVGEKALKPANLKLAPLAPKVQIHPDAAEAPTAQLQVALQRQPGEDLGLSLHAQEYANESILLINDILGDGFVKKHNDAQEDPRMCLCPGDRILAAVDGSQPENQRIPVAGHQAITKLITTGCTPIVLMIGRILGPPLRFRIGQKVKANCGEQGWLDGEVVDVWKPHEVQQVMVPYVIRIGHTTSARVVFAPNDSDDCIRKGPPRFSVGDHVMANREGVYRKATVTIVLEETTHVAYQLKLCDGGDLLEAPCDLNSFLRPVARFKKGTKVLAKVTQGFAPGIVDHCYHPEWVYAIKMETGEVVFAPQDDDSFVKKK